MSIGSKRVIWYHEWQACIGLCSWRIHYGNLHKMMTLPETHKFLEIRIFSSQHEQQEYNSLSWMMKDFQEAVLDVCSGGSCWLIWPNLQQYRSEMVLTEALIHPKQERTTLKQQHRWPSAAIIAVCVWSSGIGKYVRLCKESSQRYSPDMMLDHSLYYANNRQLGWMLSGFQCECNSFKTPCKSEDWTLC